MEEKPETLFADLYKNGEVSNLIFYSGHPSAWHSAIILHHPSAERKGICNGWKLQIKESDDPDTVMTTINIYKTGKIMVQGNLKNFQYEFQTLKTLAGAQKEKPGPAVILPLDLPQTVSSPPSPTHSSLAEDLTCRTPALIHTTMIEMRDKLAHMESELVQLQEISLQTNSLRELNKAIHLQLSTMKSQYEQTQTQLKELQDDRDTCRKELAILNKLLREIQQENTNNKKEIFLLAEKLREKDATINSLNEQLQHPTTPNPHPNEPQTLTNPPAASPDLKQPPETQTNLRHKDQHTGDKKGEVHQDHHTRTHNTALHTTQDMEQLESPQSTTKELTPDPHPYSTPKSDTNVTARPPQTWQQDLHPPAPSQTHRRSYPEALTGPPSSHDMMDIRQMLTLICTCLTDQGPW
ncbi:hypothetical protein ABVT39_024717 [Epinephelus coioides]